jgi:hypothetical protein
MVTLAGVEPATCGLGNRRSIHLSYRATTMYFNLSDQAVTRHKIQQQGATGAAGLAISGRQAFHQR